MRLLIGAMLVSALLLGGVPSARAMAPKPEPEDIANAAALMAAPWLACSLGPDSAAGLPDGMKWNWERAQFEVNDGSPYLDKFVILFDDEKRRAKILGEKKGQFLPFPTPFRHSSGGEFPTAYGHLHRSRPTGWRRIRHFAETHRQWWISRDRKVDSEDKIRV